MIRPPAAASPPSQVVMIPPAPATIGASATTSCGFSPVSTDEIDVAGGERAIGVAVAAVAHQPRLRFDPAIGLAVGVDADQRRVGRHHRRLGEARAFACAQRPGLPFAGSASPRDGARQRRRVRLPSPKKRSRVNGCAIMP